MALSTCEILGAIRRAPSRPLRHSFDSFIKRLAPDSSSLGIFGKYGAIPPHSASFTGPDRAMPDSHHIELHEERLMPDCSDDDYTSSQGRLTFIRISPMYFNQFGTAGFDIPIGNLVAWSDTLAEKVTLDDMLKMEHKELGGGESFVMQPDEEGSRIYYVASHQSIEFSEDLDIFVDSKSTTGRVGCMSHSVGIDGGRLITALQPYAFPIKVTGGKTCLSQALVRYKGTAYMAREEILSGKDISFEGDGVSLENDLTPLGLLMKFDTRKIYRAKKCDEPIDMDEKASLDWRKYFEIIERKSSITIDKKTLYLFGSLGIIGLDRACGVLSREQEVITGTGAWSHFAGIFQPGFRGGITMEVYSHSKRKISRGDKSGAVRFDKVECESCKKSGSKAYKGSYQNQVPPLLPKMFKQG